MLTQEQKEMSNRIKARRESLNFTQEQFAELIGISLSSYTKIENAFQKPALDTLIKISKNLNLSLDYMVFGTNECKASEISESDFLKSLLNFSDKEKLLHASEVLSKLSHIKK